MIGINFFLVSLIYVYGFTMNPADGNTFPGLRRRPPPLSSVEETNLLNQIVENLARKRFHQRLLHDQFYNILNNQNGPNHDTVLNDDYNVAQSPSFTYEFKENDAEIEPNQAIEFAVNPSDPRYYEGKTKIATNVNDKNSYDILHQHMNNHKTNKEINGKVIFASNNSNKSLKDILFNKVKPPLDLSSKTLPIIHSLFAPKPFRGREDIAKLVQKLQQQGNGNAVINHNPGIVGQRTQEIVVKERVSDSDMYVIAIFSGVTAAIVGSLIVLGVSWTMLQKKIKRAAADVDYPAYGVTGPNKDLSPSSDKKLAQSAQLYHYQHQKQQIIGMENRQPPEQAVSHSDVESDEENEEGDYTVYECPGLASTGEMEVKNPLFIDEMPVSTPVTSASTTSLTTTTASATGTTTSNSPKHLQKHQSKPQSQQIKSLKQQDPQSPNITTTSPSSSSASSSQNTSRSQSPNLPTKSPKMTKKDKQPPPTPQRKFKDTKTTNASSDGGNNQK